MRALALALCVLALAPAAVAHRLAPSSLELRELGAERVAAIWRTPRLAPRDARPEPLLPERCRPSGPARATLEGSALISRVELRCAPGLVGSELAVTGLERSGTNALLRIVLEDGRELRAVLSAAAPRHRVPERERAAAVAIDYAWLGVRHLVGGLDHLLFLAGLLWLLPGRRRLALAVTAFTVGHGATLALAAGLGARLPVATVELAIAASLVVLALEASRPEPADSPIARRPALLPFAFGLVHGLGFAGALGEAGLPDAAIPLALLAFNLGIETAQLVVVAALLPVAAALRRARAWRPLLGELPATAVGSFGVCLVFERALAWLAAS